MCNFSNIDIFNISIQDIKVNYKDEEQNFYVNEMTDIIIPQNHKIEQKVNVENEGISFVIHLYSSKFNFDTYRNDMMVSINYTIDTALGYKYKCNNVLHVEKNSKTNSCANISPIV